MNEPSKEQLLAAGFTGTEIIRLPKALALAERYERMQLTTGEPLTSPAHCARFLRLRMRHMPREVFGVVFVDSQHRVLAYEELFQGTIDGTSVYPREVVKAALRHNASAVVLAHNHPSGVAEPSQADMRITQRITAALTLVDVRVLDHLIVGEDVTSMAERGMLAA